MQKTLSIKNIKGGVTAPKGFTAVGIHAGIKPRSALDLALVLSERAGPIAGVFTKNQILAASVVVNKQLLKKRMGQAIVVNSGNANACTGTQGMTNAKEVQTLTARHLGIPKSTVFIGSTGVIGRALPMPILRNAIPHLVKQVRRSGHTKAAKAIMTTDTKSKEFACQAKIGKHVITVGGMAKGSGMIHPNMATMLAYLTTDAAITPQALQRGLTEAVDLSFNAISVDGDSSTNDTVLCLANGLANNPVITHGTSEWHAFASLIQRACESLALQICRDGEGATKLVTIIVEGTQSNPQAKQIAQTIATSMLVKTALFGEDPNWGRIIAAIGRAGVPLDPNNITLMFDEIIVVQGGQRVSDQADARAQKVMRKKELTLWVSIGKGAGRHRLWTTDLSYEYVKINASYTT
ncbi:bifunctional glutamate N-acetyltransferase/amino-acid acetyltransferase ArgJ [Candidatus Nitronereus thalassa]|uniref:Arginine biosynthesis bifunctional protein ArgJ n=1 Tax=Candidatus Nitronereus thalassa TaxID=3020898 RepID=A0ABU3K6E6_9BACT|nr:bifunctional glutamate N-acetyltransferase/amino-acid acetyltransferase ArgJ [Candidatus Nitronereus thalassa]MDT7041958.1 bifunctional glutamate N-acetyltransferase/amino-acid acetyltransferase ArgJ [Candidatus Nitronereus thalassa]